MSSPTLAGCALPARVLFGHRGAPFDFPENTLESLRHALDVGADALEIDVHCTQDGHVVVAHDATVDRMSGARGRIALRTLEELQRLDIGFGFRDKAGQRASHVYRMVTLGAVLKALPHAFLNIDLKSPATVQPTLRIVRECAANQRVLLTSFSSWTLLRLRRAGFEGALGAGIAESLALRYLPKRVLQASARLTHTLPARLQVPRVSHAVRFDSAALISTCARLQVPIDYWVVNEPSEALELWQLGASGIVSDDPAALSPVIELVRKRDAERASPRGATS